jgi:hypothetical protein
MANSREQVTGIAAEFITRSGSYYGILSGSYYGILCT